MAEQKSPVYIGIPEHVQVRRDLLNSSKDLIGSLKAYEAIKEIRARRAELTFELHKIMDEISVLTKKTRMALPKTPSRISLEGKEEVIETEKPSKKAARKAGEDKLSALDSELSKIEARLNRL